MKVVIVPEVEVRVVIEPFTLVSVLIVAMLEVKVSPVAFWNPKLLAKRFVEVVFVPVAFTQVMLVRLSGLPSTKFVMVAVVAVRLAMLELVKVADGEKRFVMVPEVELKLLMVPVSARKFVTKRLVPVALANRKFVMVPLEALKVVTPSVSMKAFVADKFVVVTLPAVTSPKAAFQRLVRVPRAKVRSAAGTRSEFTKLKTAKLVVVPFVMVVFAREVVPVAVRSDTVSPPKRVTEVVAKAPRLVTEARVSASVAALGQPTPFDKQMAWPETVAVAKLAILAWSVEAVALPAVSVPVTVVEAARRFVVVTEIAESDVIVPLVETKVSIVPLLAVRSVTKRLEPVAFVKVVFWRLDWPLAVKTPLTVALVLKTKSAVDVPPANWMALVVVLPAFVTV